MDTDKNTPTTEQKNATLTKNSASQNSKIEIRNSMTRNSSKYNGINGKTHSESTADRSVNNLNCRIHHNRSRALLAITILITTFSAYGLYRFMKKTNEPIKDDPPQRPARRSDATRGQVKKVKRKEVAATVNYYNLKLTGNLEKDYALIVQFYGKIKIPAEQEYTEDAIKKQIEANQWKLGKNTGRIGKLVLVNNDSNITLTKKMINYALPEEMRDTTLTYLEDLVPSHYKNKDLNNFQALMAHLDITQQIDSTDESVKELRYKIAVLAFNEVRRLDILGEIVFRLMNGEDIILVDKNYGKFFTANDVLGTYKRHHLLLYANEPEKLALHLALPTPSKWISVDFDSSYVLDFITKAGELEDNCPAPIQNEDSNQGAYLSQNQRRISPEVLQAFSYGAKNFGVVKLSFRGPNRRK